MRKLIYIVTIICLSIPGLLLAQQTEMDNRQQFALAESEYQVGHIDSAIDMLNQHINTYSGTLKVSAYRLLALCSLAQDDLTNANKYVDLLLKEDPYYSISINDSERFAELIRNKKEGKTTLVTASQQAETLEEAPVPVTLITEEMIQAIGARTLKDVLITYVPGISAIEGEEANISMRGVYSYSQENILILLNGHRLNSHCTNSVAPDFRISVENIKQIEVLRGAASSLYGNVALTAVVNIITKQGGDVNGLSALYGMGDNQTYKGSLLFGKRTMNTDILLWTSIYSSRGYRHSISQDSEDFYGIIPKDGYIYVDGYNHKPAYDLGLRYQWNKFTVSFSHQYSKRVYAYNNIYILSTYDYDRYQAINGVKPGRGNASTFGSLQYTTSLKNTQIEASLSIDYENGNAYNILGDTLHEAFSNLGNMFYPEGEYIQDSINATQGVFQLQNWKNLTIGGEFKMLQKYQMGRSHGNIVLGTQYEHFNAFDNNLTVGDLFNRIILTTTNERNYTFLNGQENSFSIFAQIKHYFSPLLIFNGGLRYDFKQRYNHTKMNVISPRLSFIYLPKDYWNLKLSYARSFVDAPFFYRVSTLVYPGSDSLEPQYMDNVQLSSTVKIKPLHLTYDFNLYFNHVSDIIYLAQSAYENSGKLNMIGWENSLTYRIPHFTAWGNITYQHALDVDNYSATGNKIHAIPDFMFNVVAEKELYPLIKNLWVNAKLSAHSKQSSPISNSFVFKNYEPYINPEYRIPGYCLVDLGLRYSWNFMNFNLRCYNIFNTKYRLGGDRVPVLQAGRSMLATISFNIN
ncbi:TonB-dependent receptor [Parabacteroides sp.]